MSLNSKALYLLITIVCCNVAGTILGGMGVQGPQVQPGVNITQFINVTNVNATMTGYDYTTPYSDFPYAVLSFLTTFWNLIFWGFPSLLLSYGLPDFITYPFVGVYFLMWTIVIWINWVGGRDA